MHFPAAPAPKATNFESFLDMTLQELEALRQTKDWALGSGVTTEFLDDYAAGNLEDDDRDYIQSLLLRCPWAMKYVTNKIKSFRKTLVTA